MKILIDGRPIVDQYAGVGNYVYNLLKNLLSMVSDDKIEVLSYDISRDLLASIQKEDFGIRSIKYKGKSIYTALFDVLNLPLVDLWGKYDIIHQTYFGSLPTRNKRTKIISTIHDVIFLTHPEYFVRNNLFIAEKALKRQISHSDLIIADSMFTRRELIEKCHVSPDRVEVVHLGVDKADQHYASLEIANKKKKYGINGRYLLFVGTIEPRKNIVNLLRAFSEIKDKNAQLVIVGKRGWYCEDVFIEAERLRLGERVVFAGYINSYDKGVLLSGADIFVFPSLFEGFGIPVVEAMACGLPVIVGDNSSLPELVGDAGVLVNSLDVDELAGKIDWLMGDEDIRNKLGKQAKEQARKFSWQIMAKNTLGMYRKVGMIND